jgi:hypothetical protein
MTTPEAPLPGWLAGTCIGVSVPGERAAEAREALRLAHNAAVYANWAAFHLGVPQGFASYVYRYRDGLGALLYVGMTSSARLRANGRKGHWQNSDWWSWVMSAEYTRCHSRDEAFQRETQIRREERPLFTRTSGYAAIIAELDRETMANHATGDCYCRLTSLPLAGETVVESDQHDPSGWM